MGWGHVTEFSQWAISTVWCGSFWNLPLPLTSSLLLVWPLVISSTLNYEDETRILGCFLLELSAEKKKWIFTSFKSSPHKFYLCPLSFSGTSTLKADQTPLSLRWHYPLLDHFLASLNTWVSVRSSQSFSLHTCSFLTPSKLDPPPSHLHVHCSVPATCTKYTDTKNIPIRFEIKSFEEDPANFRPPS